MISSSFEPINKKLIFSYERQLCSKINLDEDMMTNQDCSSTFISLLNEFSSNNINLLYFLNKLLTNISNFNDICVKYFTSLIETFKYYMNKNKSIINNTINSNYPLVLILNSISKFIKIFSANQEKYNEKHKSILKQIPQFLQLFFKLFQQKYDDMILNYDNDKKVIESFFIVCLTFIEYYPTLMRSYQNPIEKFIKNIFYNYITTSFIDTNTVTIANVLYVNLYKLSPNMTNRYQDYLLIIINNIKYYLEYFRPKTIEEGDNKDKNDVYILEQKNNLFNLGEDLNKNEGIDNKNIFHADKLMEILFKLLYNIFKFMACNIYFEVNFNNIFSLFNEILNIYESLDNNKIKSSLSTIIFNGLSKTNYKFFLINTNEKVIDILIYFISNFSQYIYCYNVFFSKYINKILLNQNFFKNSIYTFNLHMKILSFFRTIISYFNYIFPEEIELIIYKHIYNNLPLLFLKYLQQNDKTILKVDEVYFKASSIKNKIYSYDNDNIGENLSPNEAHILLLEYFKILYNYCLVTKNIDQLNYKNILGGIVDLVILPPFAKFIFNIHNDIKKVIIDIIEICIKRNLIYINKQKLFHFLNNFYFFDGDLKFQAEIVINLLKIKDEEMLNDNNDDNNNYYGGVPNNIFGQVFDFNKKIKEFLSENYKKFEQINSAKIEEKKENKNIDEACNKLDEHKNNEMLNKKRKIKDEQEEDIESNESENGDSERKGNKKKKNKNIKIIKKDNKKKGNNIKEIKLEENKDDKIEEDKDENNIDNKNEEDIQIGEDIDIPDIV